MIDIKEIIELIKKEQHSIEGIDSLYSLGKLIGQSNNPVYSIYNEQEYACKIIVYPHSDLENYYKQDYEDIANDIKKNYDSLINEYDVMKKYKHIRNTVTLNDKIGLRLIKYHDYIIGIKLYIIMEKLEPINPQLLNTNNFDIVFKCIDDLSNALIQMQDDNNHVAHRDIKLDNIFLRKRDSKKEIYDFVLGDFGLMCSLDDESDEMVGTPYYNMIDKNSYSYLIDIALLGHSAICLYLVILKKYPMTIYKQMIEMFHDIIFEHRYDLSFDPLNDDSILNLIPIENKNLQKLIIKMMIQQTLFCEFNNRFAYQSYDELKKEINEIRDCKKINIQDVYYDVVQGFEFKDTHLEYVIFTNDYNTYYVGTVIRNKRKKTCEICYIKHEQEWKRVKEAVEYIIGYDSYMIIERYDNWKG